MEGLAVINEQMRLMHVYRNALCERERVRRTEARAAVARLCPEVAQLEAEATRLQAELDQARTALKAENARTRTKADHAAIREAVKAMRGPLRETRETFKAARKAAYESAPVKTALEEIDERDREQRRLLREQSGLYWGNYLFVEQSCSSFRSGNDPDFERRNVGYPVHGEWWSATEGCVVVQIQGGMSVANLLGCTDQRLRLRITGTYRKGKRQRGECWFRAGSDPKGKPVWAVAPVILHRPFPEDCRIKWAYLHRTAVGSKWKWKLRFAVSKDEWAREDAACDGKVAINAGWRLINDRVRVATWANETGNCKTLTLPPSLLSRVHHADNIQSVRDVMFNEAVARLSRWLADNPHPDWLRERTTHLGQWRSKARLASLVLHWADNRFDGDAGIFEWLHGRRVEREDGRSEYAGWMLQERHLLDWEAFERRGYALRRDDLFRRFGAVMRRKYRTVILGKVDYRQLARNKVAEENAEAKNETAARNRQHAAPGRLSQLLREGFEEFVEVSARGITQTCCWCGEPDPFDAANILVRQCRTCCRITDQDERAARNLLRAAESLTETREPLAGTEVAVG